MLDQKSAVRISALIMARRRETGIGLRAAAIESGISPSTLSRLERAAARTIPDAETLAKLSSWLHVPLSSLFDEQEKSRKKPSPRPSTPEVITAHLRADRNLSEETARALAEMFKALYSQFTEKPPQSRSRP